MEQDNTKIEFFENNSKRENFHVMIVVTLTCLIVLLGLFAYFYVFKPIAIVHDCNAEIAKISSDSVDAGKGIGLSADSFMVSGEQIKENSYANCLNDSVNIFALDPKFSYERSDLMEKFILVYLLVTMLVGTVSIKFFGDVSIGRATLLGVVFSSTSFILFSHHIFSALPIVVPTMILIYYLLRMHDWFTVWKISYFLLYIFNGLLYVMVYFAYSQANLVLSFIR